MEPVIRDIVGPLMGNTPCALNAVMITINMGVNPTEYVHRDTKHFGGESVTGLGRRIFKVRSGEDRA